MKDVDLLNLVKDFVGRLNSEAERGAMVVVEGVRDVEALQSLGYRGDIYPVCHGGSISKMVSKAEKYRKAILLFDLDSEGRSLTRRAAVRLHGKKAEMDLMIRKEFAQMTKGRLKHVQDLRRFGELLG